MRAIAKLAVVLSLAGCSGRGVVRIVDGVPIEGRFVSASAYAAYLQAAEREARGDQRGALAAYGSAIDRDPESVLPWVRVGEIRCSMGETERATAAFDEAEARAPRFEPLWRARAACALAVDDAHGAVVAARRGVAERPREVETVILLARALAATDQPQEARRYLVSLAVQYPERRDIWVAMSELGDAAWVARADERLAELEAVGVAGDVSSRLVRERKGWLEVDRALRDGELDAARRAMLRAGIDHRLLAARALMLGEAELALEEAELRLDANPAESDARVALALAADLAQNEPALVRALRRLPTSSESLSASGRLMMAELLARRAGPDATAAWTDGPADIPALRRRLAETLAAAR